MAMISPYLIHPPLGAAWLEDLTVIPEVGRKARGLSAFPPAWRPPFCVLASRTYSSWMAEGFNSSIIDEAATLIGQASHQWRDDWPRGLILRSSASTETLDDRGAHESRRLSGDYSVPMIGDALQAIFTAFRSSGSPGDLAVIVQPLVREGRIGHLSNERRVSKTVNQWRWECMSPIREERRLNSQRDNSPDPRFPIEANAQARKLQRTFGSVGHWIVSLDRGPAHLEWALDGKYLWLVQLDFERERPDDGVDPTVWRRDNDDRPPGRLPLDSPFALVDVDAPTGPWRKVENVKRFTIGRRRPYPPLITITGDRFRDFLARSSILERSLDAFAHGRLVCRTDCKTPGFPRENLPRTNTVTSEVAVERMTAFLESMEADGAEPQDVCFVAHKFIPATASAWVRADPASSLVRVDCLWGVPDGLQYLPHDSFEYDVARKRIVSERVRWKPRFIQECNDGSWQELRVRRSLARSRSLPSADVSDVAETSHEIAAAYGGPLLIMWFCQVPNGLGIGCNLPWFSMPATRKSPSLRASGPVSPQWPRKLLQTAQDAADTKPEEAARTILVLDPHVELFRDDKSFLSAVMRLAKASGAPVQLAGSSLAHAYYQLEKAGVSVIPADGAGRTRSRGRRSFDKLVRDRVPGEIAAKGEEVVGSQLQRSELRHALVAKLLEEAQELLAATDPDDVKAELSDLLEVVRAMAAVTGVSWEEVEASADEKRARRGGFESGAVLVETTLPTDDGRLHRRRSLVTLRELGRVVSDEERSAISYNALLADHGAGARLNFGGREFILRLARDGAVIVMTGSDNLPTQLSLPLDVGE